MSESANHCLHDLEEKELKNLATHPGPKQYLAFNEMAHRTREDPAGWEPTFWPGPKPKAPHVELAFLLWSQQFNGERDLTLQQKQDARIKELECGIRPDPESLVTQFYNAIHKEIQVPAVAAEQKDAP